MIVNSFGQIDPPSKLFRIMKWMRDTN